MTLEVIVTSVEDAIAAARGGAHRLEVVRELDRGGLTPPATLVCEIQRALPLPLRVMVRESDGFGRGTPDEGLRMADAAAAFDALGVDGVVVGWTRGSQIDDDMLARVLEAAPSLRATFHHAFDALPDPEAAFDALKRHRQIDRVLTRGGPGAWPSRCVTLTRYARWARPEIALLPGGGVDIEALRALAGCAAVTEAHVGRAARVRQAADAPVSADLVRGLVRACS